MQTFLSVLALTTILSAGYAVARAQILERHSGALQEQWLKRLRFYTICGGTVGLSFIFGMILGVIVLVVWGGYWSMNAMRQGARAEQSKGGLVQVSDKDNPLQQYETEKKKALPSSEIFETRNPFEALLRNFGQRIINYSESKTFTSSAQKLQMQTELFTAFRERADEIEAYVEAYVKATGNTEFPDQLTIPGTNAVLDLPPIYHGKLQRILKKVQMRENTELLNAEAQMVEARINLEEKHRRLDAGRATDSEPKDSRSIQEKVEEYCKAPRTRALHEQFLDDNEGGIGIEMVFDDIVLKTNHLIVGHEEEQELKDVALEKAKLIFKAKYGAR